VLRFLAKLFGKLGLIGLISWLLNITPASAALSCRQIDGHQICIEQIERSAKNYWQYQAMVSKDGLKLPIASYDCREKLITDFDGNISSFRNRKDGGFVCSLYRRRG
jgi:hypothetical protein